MTSTYSFPQMKPAEIVLGMHSYGIATRADLHAEEILNPPTGFLADVIVSFLATVVGYELEEQLQFQALQAVENPEHYTRSAALRRLHKKAKAFFETIQFPELTLRDLVRADGPRVVRILSALINFLHYRQEKLSVLEPNIQDFGVITERKAELTAEMAELHKVKEDHLLKEQMEAPAVQQLGEEIVALNKRLGEYNKEQLSLRHAAISVNEKKEEIRGKINQADFELVKVTQEKKRLLAKVVDFPDKFLTTLEEKKAVRDELKSLEKMAEQKVKEKNNTIETYTKVSEKLSKHLSKISALHERIATAKASEKDVKAQKDRVSDQNLEIKELQCKTAEWQSKVLKTEANLKAKEKERDKRVGENNRKMTALKSELESEHKFLEDRKSKMREKVEKGYELCSQVDSVVEAARKQAEEIYAKYDQVYNESNMYVDGIDHSFREIEEAAELLHVRGYRVSGA